MSQALIGFKTPNHSEGERAFENSQKITSLISQANDVRALGSSVLMMAYTAADRLHGAMLCDMDELSLNAGSLIAHEAGCLTANLTGEPLIKAPADILVANPRLLKELIQKV